MCIRDRKFTNHWSREAAELSAQIWSKQMRYVYGWGTHTLDDATIPARLVHNMVIREILNTLVHAGLLWAQPDNEFCDLKKASLMVSQWLMSTDEQLNNIFTVRFKDERKLTETAGAHWKAHRCDNTCLYLKMHIHISETAPCGTNTQITDAANQHNRGDTIPKTNCEQRRMYTT